MFGFIRRSEPLHIIRFGVQSHVLLRSTFKATSSFDVQSHCLSSFRRSKPCLISFNVQSHYISFVSGLRAMFCFVRRSELHLRLTFRSTSSFGFRSRIFIRCSEPLFVFLFRVQSRGFSSTLRVLMSIFCSTHHHFPPLWRLEPLGTLLRIF